VAKPFALAWAGDFSFGVKTFKPFSELKFVNFSLVCAICEVSLESEKNFKIPNLFRPPCTTYAKN
jgi:hypothetical protein